MFIYKIENKINGKIYIGKTEKNNPEDRWKSHCRDAKYRKTKLYNAFKKYGIINFEFYVIEFTGKVTRQRLNEREIYWIEVLSPEYNMTKGGDGGFIHSQLGKKWKIKNTCNMRKPKTVTDKVLEGRKKVSGGLNYQSKYVIHTPWGEFQTWLEACNSAKELRKSGNKLVIVNSKTLKQYCLHDIILNKEGRRTPSSWRGKSTKNLGFFVKVKYE